MREASSTGKKIRQALGQMHLIPDALRLVWTGAGHWSALWWGLLLVQGLLPVGVVFLTRSVVDGLVGAVDQGGSPEALRAVAWPAAILAVLYLAREGLGAILVWVRTVQSDRVRDHLSDLIHSKSVAADLAFYESADFYDHLHRAKTEAGFRSVSLVEGLGSLVQSGVTLVAMLGVLVPYGFWLPLALLGSTLPALVVVVQSTFREHSWWLRRTPDERRSRYFDWLLTSGGTAAELRLFALGDHFRGQYQEIRREMREERAAIARRKALGQLVASAIALGLGAAALAWMGLRAARGEVTLGDVALFLQAFYQGQGLLRELLGHLGQILANTLFLESLFEFLAMEPQIRDPDEAVALPARLREGVRFEGITFRYPGRKRAALENFDLHLEAGRVTAVVGHNGAGKSTLVKLLCRFYDPERGRITVDGIDLKQAALADLREAITVLFQVPVRFHATVAENIALGDLGSSPDRERIRTAAEAAGADEPIAHLGGGYDTPLGKVYADGADLSVGEWQRLALARAFLRQAPILLLDEPTSAMDSWAAGEWMGRLKNLAKDRTALIITHRFTTAMRADVIHVLHEGRIVESGSHEGLLEQGGRYAEAWRSQRLGDVKGSRVPS